MEINAWFQDLQSSDFHGNIFSPATIDVLPSIRAAVGPDIEIILDGGVQRGTDIAKVGGLVTLLIWLLGSLICMYSQAGPVVGRLIWLLNM